MSKHDYTDGDYCQVGVLLNDARAIMNDDARELRINLIALENMMKTIPIKNNYQRQAMAHLNAAVEKAKEIYDDDINKFRENMKIALDLPVRD